MLHQYYIIIHQFIYNSTPILYNKYVNTPIYTLSHFRALTFHLSWPKKCFYPSFSFYLLFYLFYVVSLIISLLHPPALTYLYNSTYCPSLMANLISSIGHLWRVHSLIQPPLRPIPCQPTCPMIALNSSEYSILPNGTLLHFQDNSLHASGAFMVTYERGREVSDRTVMLRLCIAVVTMVTPIKSVVCILSQSSHRA